MIERVENPLLGFGEPVFYSACLDCGWCSRLKRTELAAGEADDNHLAAKLAARADRRGAFAPLMPGPRRRSVGDSSEARP